jgi:nucleoside 2-deoxyribosyltransferase
MRDIKKVYLAGAITHHSYDGANGWREHVSERLEHCAICKSPMRLKDHLKDVKKFGPHGTLSGISSNRAIFGRDSWDVRQCDIVLVNVKGLEVASVGTLIEMGIAHAEGKLILLVIGEDEWTIRTPGVEATPTTNPFDHVFVHQVSDIVVHDLEEAIEIIEAL